MMKKLLILMLVLGMASAANAIVVSLDPTGAVTAPAGSYSLDVLSDTDDFAYEYFLHVPDLTYGTITAVAILAAAGDDAGITDYGDVMGAGTYTIAINAADSAEPFNVAAGIQFTATIGFTGSAVGEDLTIQLWDDQTAVIDSMTYNGIPEPMTIALLGLGGLFLLRRRK